MKKYKKIKMKIDYHPSNFFKVFHSFSYFIIIIVLPKSQEKLVTIFTGRYLFLCTAMTLL